MICIQCGKEFEAKRKDAQFCPGSKCRVAAARGKPKLAQALSVEEIVVKAKDAAKPAKAVEAKTRKPLLNKMTGEPRLHSGWYFRTDLYRAGVIKAIQADPTLGEVEKSEKYGWLITRTREQKALYDATIPVEQLDGDWVAKFDGEWLTHEQCRERGIDSDSRERTPLFAA